MADQQHRIVSLSEKGGAAKTTLTLLMAMAAVQDGWRVAAVDLDPRATLTKVLGATFRPGYSVDAILAAANPHGWAADLAVPSTWHDDLLVLPAERSLGNREQPGDQSGAGDDLDRLNRSLVGLDADLVIADTPPRPGGVLVKQALALDDVGVVYAGVPDQDGLDGVAEAWQSVTTAQAQYNPSLRTLGIALSRVDTRTSDARRCITDFKDIYGDLLMTPHIPERVIVREVRSANEWVGNYASGDIVSTAAKNLWLNLRTRIEKN